ncbi:hypothetical protein G7Y89_g9935 [Cudoniella acicularis]|uniref:Uncharacterized protein n=1 Tax=Cudoniella acicularis TaxID=354080 RepID=A0A8H4RHE5_9HELO|nr:hypothetical protein G7Y89_g9935 [Cudoniella acicularis]
MGNDTIEGEAIEPVTAKSKQSSSLSLNALSKPPSKITTIDDASFHSPRFNLYNRISRWLVIAGFKHRYYPLWELAVKGRILVIVHDPGLHLTWKDSVQYIKPLPACFGNPKIVTELSENGGEGLKHARGFFHSYTRIVKSECDYDIAVKKGLLPDPWLSLPGFEGWKKWKSLVEEWKEANPPADGQEEEEWSHRYPLPPACHGRYTYGELRLTRLNWIMWLLYLPHYFEPVSLKSYFYITEDPFGKFWQGYGKWVALLFIYVTVLLASLQLALTAGAMPHWFKDGCLVISYGLILLVLAHAILFIVYMWLWIIDQLVGYLRLQFWRTYQRHSSQG